MQKKADPHANGDAESANANGEEAPQAEAPAGEALAETTGHVKSPRGRVRRFSLMSGDRPLEGFTIKRGVGTGGFGEVYYATTDAGKEVALKRIERNLDIELRGVRQCLNLKHPNLVSVFDIKYDEDEQAWVVMEFVSGESLAEVLERNPNGMPLDEVNRWFTGITAGVGHLHDSGIVHRDLKPGNIFSDQSTVKIGDYGLSKFISCSRRSGHTQSVGTFHYMAPEVGQGRYGKEIDIYALGIMLYEMITGRVPYEGESSHEIIMKHLTATPVLTGIPQPYAGIISTSLSKDPAARRLSVHQMREIIAEQPAVYDAKAVDHHGNELAGLAPLFQGTPIEAARNAMHSTAASMRNAGIAAKISSPFSFADDPIAQGVKKAFADISRGWQQTRFGTITKVAILLAAVPLVWMNTRLLLPMILVTLFTYALYFLIRGTILYTVPEDEAGVAVANLKNEQDDVISNEVTFVAPPVVAELAPMNRAQRKHFRSRQLELKKVDDSRKVRVLRDSLFTKTRRRSASDTLGSLIMATLVCVVAGLSFLITQNFVSGTPSLYLPTCLWAIATSAFAASGLLIVGNSWQKSSEQGQGGVRRLFQVLVGMATGAVSWAMLQYMQFMPEYWFRIGSGPLDGVFRVNGYGRPNGLYNVDAEPTLAGFMVFFAALFVVARWWRLADPIRETRLSIWRTILCGLAAVAVSVFVPIPAGIAIAVVTAVAIQISASYVDHDRRRLICENVITKQVG